MRTLLFTGILAVLAACTDADGDGHPRGADCDDLDAAIHPDADEWCNGVDDDCDDEVDEPEAVDARSWFYDGDSDGHGVPEDPIVACTPPDGHAPVDDDCDDEDPAVHPGAIEDDCADPVDYNCDDSVMLADADDDGHAACAECDDGDPQVHPGADERCNGIDDDCDGEVDEPDAVDAPTWYLDDDGDGFGDPEVSVVACAPPADHVADDTDCDDEDEAVNPGAVEVCNEVDDDCAEGVDVDAVDAPTWYLDGDGDGFGTVGTAVVACAPTTGQVAAWGDCDDSRDDTYPGAAWGDSGFDCMRDADEDGYGDRDATSPVVPGTDCADDDDARHPAADEVFYDGIDQDCDDGSDYDADEDGYDSEDHGGTDCYDDNAEARPGATDYHAADRGDGSWDYDCDEAETRQSTAVTPTTCYSLEEYTELGWYWDGPGVPGCGETAQWELAVCECEWISFGLGEYWNCGVRTWDDEDAAQACR